MNEKLFILGAIAVILVIFAVLMLAGCTQIIEIQMPDYQTHPVYIAPK